MSIRCPFCGDVHASGTAVCPTTQRRLAGLLTEGTVIDGKYRVQGIIGVGGMAAVYRAEHTKIGRIVALKMLLPEYVVYPELSARVEREARAAGGIDHPNVVAIVDLGTTPEHGPYIAMELLKGEELASHIERAGGMLDPLEAAEICRQVLGALDVAHQRGVVHRDLKPENIFLARVDDERVMVKVLDFGISKLGAQEKGISSLTRTGTVMGTPQFMAPEQAAGAKEQDARVDIYACGAVLYAMLTGALPYQAENYNLLINEILNKPPVPILDRNRGLDPTLAAIVMRAIARRPEGRFPSARAMQDAIVGWLDEVLPERSQSGLHRLGNAATVPAVVMPGMRPSRPGSGSYPAHPSSPGTTQPIALQRTATASPLTVDPLAPVQNAGDPPPAPLPLPPVNRADTRTPLGWENTPGPVMLPKPQRSRVLLYTLLSVGVLCGAAFAVRAFDPGHWNKAMATLGMNDMIVPLGPEGEHAASGSSRSHGHTTPASGAAQAAAHNAAAATPPTPTPSNDEPPSHGEAPTTQATTAHTTPTSAAGQHAGAHHPNTTATARGAHHPPPPHHRPRRTH